MEKLGEQGVARVERYLLISLNLLMMKKYLSLFQSESMLQIV